MCTCCSRSVEKKGFGDVPPHALALYTEPSEADKSWSILLLSEKEYEMRDTHRTSIYMHDRVSRTLMFKSRVAAFKANSDEMDALKDKAVRDVLRMCIVNGQHTESVVTLEDARQFAIVSIPVWDEKDVLAGSLWTAKLIAVEDEESVTPLAARKRAALYYDVNANAFILNESWMRQRDLLSGSFTGKDGENAVLLVDPKGHVDMAKNMQKAGELACVAAPLSYPCDLSEILIPRVTNQLQDAFAYLRDNSNQGRVLTGFTVGQHGYSVMVTKIFSQGQGLDGFAITIHEEDSLANIVQSLQPEHDSP